MCSSDLQLLFLYIVLKCIISGEKAAEKQWEGADSVEWTHLPSPAPYHSFATPPVLDNKSAHAAH